MSDLNAAISKELRRVIAEQGLTVSAAARMLNISRQAFHSYLSGKSLPRAAVLARAAELWSIRITVGQVSFDSSSFNHREGKPTLAPKQLELAFLRKFDAIGEKDLHIALKRQGNTLQVSVRIDIPA